MCSAGHIHLNRGAFPQAFDDLLLMKVGGSIIYHGEQGARSARLIAYFEVRSLPPKLHARVRAEEQKSTTSGDCWLQSIPGVPPLREGLNPATWMLQITTPGVDRLLGVDFAAQYLDSSLYRHAPLLRLSRAIMKRVARFRPCAKT